MSPKKRSTRPNSILECTINNELIKLHEMPNNPMSKDYMISDGVEAIYLESDVDEISSIIESMELPGQSKLLQIKNKVQKHKKSKLYEVINQEGEKSLFLTYSVAPLTRDFVHKTLGLEEHIGQESPNFRLIHRNSMNMFWVVGGENGKRYADDNLPFDSSSYDAITDKKEICQKLNDLLASYKEQEPRRIIFKRGHNYFDEEFHGKIKRKLGKRDGTLFEFNRTGQANYLLVLDSEDSIFASGVTYNVISNPLTEFPEFAGSKLKLDEEIMDTVKGGLSRFGHDLGSHYDEFAVFKSWNGKRFKVHHIKSDGSYDELSIKTHDRPEFLERFQTGIIFNPNTRTRGMQYLEKYGKISQIKFTPK